MLLLRCPSTTVPPPAVADAVRPLWHGRLLNRYRHKYRCFNDDIQGTGCVTLAGILAASQTAGSHIKETKVMCVGAGSAGLGVCTAIKEGMVAAGLSEEAARERFVLCNHNGALGRKDGKHGKRHLQSSSCRCEVH